MPLDSTTAWDPPADTTPAAPAAAVQSASPWDPPAEQTPTSETAPVYTDTRNVVGIDALSTAGRSYKTLVNSPEFRSVKGEARQKLLDQWERTDFLARARAGGDSEQQIKADAAAIRRDYAKNYGAYGLLDSTVDLPVSVLSGFAGLVKDVGDTYGLTSGDTANLLSQAGKDAQEYWDSFKSGILKNREKDQAAYVKQADGIISSFWRTIEGVASDPALLGSFAAQQFPQVIPGAAVGRGVVLGAKAVGVGAGAAISAGTAASVGTAGVLQGADVGSDNYDQALQEVKRLNPGVSDQDAHDRALSTARKTAVAAGLVTLAIGMVPGASNFERLLVSGTAPGKTLGHNAITSAIKAGLKEGGSETFEEGLGKAGSNLALRDINPEQSLTEGVGEAAGQGFLGGVAMAGIGHTLGRAENAPVSVPPPGTLTTSTPVAPTAPTTTPAGGSPAAPTAPVLPAGAQVLNQFANGDLQLKLTTGEEVRYTVEDQARAEKAAAQTANVAAVAATLAANPTGTIQPVTPAAPVAPAAPVVQDTNTYQAPEDHVFPPTLPPGVDATPEQLASVGYRPSETAKEAADRLADFLLTTSDPAAQQYKSEIVEDHLNAYLGYIVNENDNGRYTGGIDPDIFVSQLNSELDAALIAKGIALDPARTDAASKVAPLDATASRLDQGSRYLGDGKYLSEAAYLDRISGKESTNGKTPVQENTLASVVQEAGGIEPRSNNDSAQSTQRTDTESTASTGEAATGKSVRSLAAVPAKTTGEKPARPPRPGAPGPRLNSTTATNRTTTPGDNGAANAQLATADTTTGVPGNGVGLPSGVQTGDSGAGAARPSKPTGLRVQSPTGRVSYTSPVGGNPVTRYNAGSEGFKLVFQSSYDRDAYMVQSAKPGKSDSTILAAAARIGIDEANLRAHGAAVKAAIKEAASQTEGGTAKAPAPLRIPTVSENVNAAPPAPEIVKKSKLGTKQGGAIGVGLLTPVANAVQGLINATTMPGTVLEKANAWFLNQKQVFARQFGLEEKGFDDASQTALNRNDTLKALTSERLKEALHTIGALAAKYNNSIGEAARSINRRITDEVKERATAGNEFRNGANAHAIAIWAVDGNKELRERRVNEITDIDASIARAKARLAGFDQAIAQGNPTDTIIDQRSKVQTRIKQWTRQSERLKGGLDLFDRMDGNSTYQQMTDAAEAIVKQQVAKRMKPGFKKDDVIRQAVKDYMMGATAGLSTFDAKMLQADMKARFGADAMQQSHDAIMKAHLAVRQTQDRYHTYLTGEFHDLATDPYAATRLPTEFAQDSRPQELNADKASAFRNGSHTPQRAAFDESLKGKTPPVDVLVGIERYSNRVAYQSGIGALVQYLADAVRNGNTKIKLMTEAEYQSAYNGVRADETDRQAKHHSFRLYERRVSVDGAGVATTYRQAMRVVFDSGDLVNDAHAANTLFNTIAGTSAKSVREFGTGRGVDPETYRPTYAAYRELMNATQRSLTYLPAFNIYNQELSDARSKQANMVRSGILEKADGSKLVEGPIRTAQTVIKAYTSGVVRLFVDGTRQLASGINDAAQLIKTDKIATAYQRAAQMLLDGKPAISPEAQLLQRMVDDGIVNLRGTTHLDVSNDANVRRSLRVGAKGTGGRGLEASAVGVLSRMSAYIEWTQRQRNIAVLSIGVRTIDAFMKQGATYESAAAAYRHAYDETKIGSLTSSAWAGNVSFLAASATEVGSALRSYSAQPLTTSRVAHLAYLTALGIGVSTALKYALSYASMMMGGADEPDEDKKKAFGNKQQQQRATQSRDTLMLYGALLSVPSSYNPSISFEQSIATEAVKALDGRDFNMDNIAQNVLKSTVGPFGSYRFTSIGDSLNPKFDLFLASIATAVGSNPLTEAVITAMSGRDVFGKELTDNPHARIGDVKLPSDVTFNGRIADALSGVIGVNVSEKHVGALLSNFPYIKDVSTAVGLNRFVRKDDSEYTASFAWRKAEADLRPLVEKFNANRQKVQRENGERQTNAQFSSKSLPEAQDFIDAGMTPKEAHKLEIYYEVTNATRAATQDKEGKARMVTKLGRQENDNVYAQGILALRALE